jgi:hypothetical protein
VQKKLKSLFGEDYTLKNLPSPHLLTVAVHFCHAKGVDSLHQHLQSRQMIVNESKQQ